MLGPQIRSRGCSNCKLRKKKCDGTTPSCDRCTKSGRICPGYAKDAEIKIRDMTKISERKVLSRTAGRDRDRLLSTETDLLPDNHLVNFDTFLKSRLDAVQRVRLSLQGEISRSISTDWKEIAIPRLFFDWGSESQFFINGGCAFLPKLYAQRMSSVHFDEALRAVAFINLANQLGMNDLSLEARKLYGSAITRIVTKLRKVEDATDDTVIASSWLFSIFEVISIKAVPKGFMNNPHDLGRMSLLRARGIQKINTPLAMNLFTLVFIHNLYKCLHNNLTPPEELLLWLDNSKLPWPTSDYNHSGVILKCSWAIATFCASAQRLFDSTDRDERWVLDLLKVIKTGIAVENKCEEWGDSTLKDSPEWGYKTCHPRSTSIKISKDYPPLVYIDRYMAWIWNYFRACRIRLHEVLLHCLTCIQSHPCVQSLSFDHETIGKESRSIIDEMVHDICCSTYFCLGQIDSKGEPRTERPIPHWGYQTFWSFYIAMVSSKDGSTSQVWLKNALEYITDVMGIEMGRMLARRQKVDPWDVR